MQKISWDKYFCNILDSLKLRASCDRGYCTALITKENHIIATGYAGSLPGMPECSEVGHDIRKIYNFDTNKVEEHCVRTVHAEQNAICSAAKYGISLKDTTLYVSMTPCMQCCKLIVTAGINRVVIAKRYANASEQIMADIFKACSVSYKFMEDGE